MADDPNRDILPVKDDSCYGSVPCFSEIDPRERHVVCKLDRYQLEDRYLRLLDEVQGLKKLSNSQEDKIKKLATKLMRSAASSRTCPAVIAINDEREKITRLELKNSRLKVKADTLKNQLLSHRGPTSPSRCRRVASGISSGPTTYRSESARTKYQSQPRNEVDDNDAQNYLLKIEELETQKNELITRVAELESQIAVHVTGIQREKVQDNVEYIRMWRQMKQANDKLVSIQTANDTLHAQVADLKKLLEETTKNNREITAALVSEKQKQSEINDQVKTAKDSQLSLREKDEQIRDLTNELKILQQHNKELIELSSKFGQVERDNIELKRKLSDFVQENHSLKSSLKSEQAEHAALKAANDKLIRKVEELQKNMDNLNVQLMAFQNQGDKKIASKGTQTEVNQAHKKIGTIYEPKRDSIPSEEDREPYFESTEDDRKLRSSKKESKEAKRIKTEVKDRSGAESAQKPRPNSRLISSKTKHTEQIASPSMSREKILMLLDQAQISTPLEAQNAARMRQIDVGPGQNDASTFPEAYRSPITIVERPSNDGSASTDFELTLGDEDDRSQEEIEFFDPKEMLLTLCEILKGYSENVESSSTVNTGCCYFNHSKYQLTENLNSLKNVGRENESNDTCALLYEKLKAGIGITKSEKVERIKGPYLMDKCTETMSCICDSNHKCSVTSDCGYGCCKPEIDGGLLLLEKSRFPCPNNPALVESRVGEIGSTIQKTFDSIYMRRCSDFNYGRSPESFDNRNDTKPANASNRSTIDKSPKVVSRELERCKELLRTYSNLNGGSKKEKKISDCEPDCCAANECGDTPAFCETSAFPLLVTKEQGLVEIHILALQLSAKATPNIFKSKSHDVSVFISWEVWGQETAFTPTLKYPSLTFNSSSVYRVCDLQNFFDSVLREHIVFQVHVINQNEETFTVAKAKLSVKDILDFPQNKLQYTLPVLSVMPCSCDRDFGLLSLWIRMSCDINLVENFKDRCGLVTAAVSKRRQTQIPTQQRKEESGSYSTTRKAFLSINPTPANNTFPYAELTTAPLRDILLDAPEAHKSTTLGYPPKVKNQRLDTIRESAEPVHREEPSEKTVKKGNYRSENPVEEWSDNDIRNNAYSMSSVATYDNDSQDSDVGIDETIAATTSRGLPLLASQKKRDSGQQIESGSISEFNNVLKNRDDGAPHRAKDNTADDVETVIADDKWEKYKRNNLRTKSEDSNYLNVGNTLSNKNNPAPIKDTITISIVSMNLFNKTSLMDDPDIYLLYVEYSFLGMRGADMETVALPKPQNKGESMVFNFTRSFKIDAEYHISQRNMLTSMLSGSASPIIRFIIVSEPLPENVDTKECVEVGHADLNIREYALGDGLRDVPLIIMNPGQSEQFGMLKITIDGIEIIRNCMIV